VNLDPDSWYAREFGERAGMRIRAAVLLGDGTWITADSTYPPRTTTWFTRLLRNLAIVDGVMLVLLFFAVRLQPNRCRYSRRRRRSSAATSTGHRFRKPERSN